MNDSDPPPFTQSVVGCRLYLRGSPRSVDMAIEPAFWGKLGCKAFVYALPKTPTTNTDRTTRVLRFASAEDSQKAAIAVAGLHLLPTGEEPVSLADLKLDENDKAAITTLEATMLNRTEPRVMDAVMKEQRSHLAARKRSQEEVARAKMALEVGVRKKMAEAGEALAKDLKVVARLDEAIERREEENSRLQSMIRKAQDSLGVLKGRLSSGAIDDLMKELDATSL